MFPALMHALKLAAACAAGAGLAKDNPKTVQTFFSPCLWRDFVYRPISTLTDINNPIIPNEYVLYPTESDAWDFVRDVERHPELLLAYDIETPRSGEADENESDELGETTILSIQFSLRRGSGIFLPWRAPFDEIAKLVLATPNAKAGANTWRFDNPLLEAHGCRLNGANHDVRWAWHHLQPDMKAALQFIASFYCPMHEGWTVWKHLHDSEFKHFYGVRDVDAIQYIFAEEVRGAQ